MESFFFLLAWHRSRPQAEVTQAPQRCRSMRRKTHGRCDEGRRRRSPRASLHSTVSIRPIKQRWERVFFCVSMFLGHPIQMGRILWMLHSFFGGFWFGDPHGQYSGRLVGWNATGRVDSTQALQDDDSHPGQGAWGHGTVKSHSGGKWTPCGHPQAVGSVQIQAVPFVCSGFVVLCCGKMPREAGTYPAKPKQENTKPCLPNTTALY